MMGEINLLVSLIGNKSINKIILPKVVIGNYWITDIEDNEEKKLVNIESQDNKWQIKSSSYARIIDPKSLRISENGLSIQSSNFIVKEKVILKPDSMYAITIGYSNKIYILYCSDVYDKSLKSYNFVHTTKEISIGSDANLDIVYASPLILKKHARIFISNEKWMFENLDKRENTTYINNRILKEKIVPLFWGDVIYIMGLKIIFLNGKLYINNPLGKVKLNKLILEEDFYKFPKILEKFEEDNNIELWTNKDYFSKVPRLTNWVEEEKVKIDSIPAIQQIDDKPMILMMGTSMAMGTTMIISITNTLERSLNGEATLRNTITSLIATGAMMMTMILMPVLNRNYEKKRKKEYEKKRQWRYRKYLSIKQNVIDDIRNKQRDILLNNFLQADDCVSLILSKDNRLWERNVNDKDFMNIRLGTGNIHIKADISYPEERFTMYDDELEDVLIEMERNSELIENAPITMSLTQKNVVSFISKDDTNLIKYIKNLIIQLVTFQSYEELKLVFLLKKETAYQYEFAKNLPHTWDNYRKFRYFATDLEEAKNVIKNISNSFQIRDTMAKNTEKKQACLPFYLIITDNYPELEGITALQDIINSEKRLGFSIMCLGNNLTDLPNECKTFVNISEDKAEINEVEIDENEKTDVNGKFEIDTEEHYSLERVVKTLANIPIRFNSTNSTLNIKEKYTFLEMYDVGMVEQLNILDRWNKNDTSMSLKAPIGIDANGSKIMLDIHENAHGPHGLIAGTTGSGKSEFIITYILSLAINYRPDDVTFILIDYKGGGLAGAFKKNNVKLPHLVGTITNIEKVGLQRSLASIESELRKRQILFNEARDKTDGGTIDIYKYQRLYHEGVVQEPIPHLLIICDEFAELKQQQPEFMEELMSVSRIGRSLGVHLILATQKPSGIVNDQIRSNSKFAVCLKVQDRSDSNDVIKHPDAANLKTSGTFYLNVGNDEYYTLGQSGWSGAQYVPSNIVEKKIDNSIEFISNTGSVIKSINDKIVSNSTNNGDQLTYIVKYLDELAKLEKIEMKQLWLESIPEKIFVQDLRKKYNIKEDNVVKPIIGEYDDPSNQKQGIVNYNLLEDGNSIIYGSADSGKENLISTLVYDIMCNYSIDSIGTYILDFGSEAFKIFKDSPTVGDVIVASEKEKLERFFDIILNEFNKRKMILSNYNGDYDLYLKTSGKTMPLILIIINGYDVFTEITENKYEDILTSLTRDSVKYGIIFCVTTTSYNNMRFRLSQNFKKKIALRLNKEDELFNIFENVGKKRASNLFGRGLITLEDNKDLYEFQTARICEAEDYNLVIKNKIEELKSKSTKSVSSIPVMPTKVTYNMLKNKLKTLKNIPLGLVEKDLSVSTYNFKKDFVTLMIARNVELASDFSYKIIEEIKNLNINVEIFDAESTEADKKQEFLERYNKFEESLLSKNVKGETLCIIIGLDKFWDIIGKREVDFYNLLKNANETKLFNFIIVENLKKMKSHEYEQWYKNYISGDTGIFVGNGIDDQYTINISTPRRELKGNCGTSYGYVITSGNAVQIKLLEMTEEVHDA